MVIDPDAPGQAQVVSGLPAEVLNELLAAWNDSATVRLPAGFTLPAGAVLQGDVAAFRGTLRIAGTVEGSLTVINGTSPSSPVAGCWATCWWPADG